MNRPLAWVTWMVLAAAPAAWAQDVTPRTDGLYRLTLRDGLWRFHRDRHSPCDLTVEVSVINGKPGMLRRAAAPTYSRGGIELSLGVFERRADGLAAEFEVTIKPDGYVAGGTGRFSCTLRAQGEGLAGTYTGSFTQEGQPPSARSGSVEGAIVPFWPGLAPQVRFTSGEHPRLLFRAADIPALKAFAQTPAGKALVADLEKRLPAGGVAYEWTRNPANATPYAEGYYAMGEAFLHVLTGKQEHFDRARELMLRCLSDRSGEAGGWGNAPRMSGAAVAYDLLYNDLDEPTRQAMQGYLRQPTDRNTFGIDVAGADMAALMFSSAAIVGDLAILGDPCPEPAVLDPDRALAIAPPADLVIADGVPVQVLVSGEMPREWLNLGTYADDGSDPLAALGGPAKARPDLKTVISHGGNERQATLMKAAGQRLSFGHNYRRHPAWGFNLLGVKPAKGRPINLPSVFYAYCVVEVDKERVMVAQPNRPDVTSGARMWLAGTELQQGQLVRLVPGKYPLLCRIPTRPLFAAPNLVDYAPWMRDAAALEDELWRAEGKTVPLVSLNLHNRLAWVRAFIAAHVGDRGLMNEALGITDARSEALLAAAAFRALFGTDLDPAGRLAWSLPLNLHTGEQYWSNDWGAAFWPAFALQGTFPPDYAPVFRYILEARALAGTLASQPNHDVLGFINLWRLQANPAASPEAAKLPLHFVDRSRGLYVFRNGWGPDAISVSAMLQTANQPTSVCAGSLLVHHGQAGRLAGRYNLGAGYFERPRPGHKFYLAAQLLVGTCEPDGGAVASAYQPRPDGSGTLTMRIERLVDRGGAESKVAATQPVAGLSQTRSVLVDYTRASGADAVIVVADTVEGAAGRPIRWLLPTPLRPPVVGAIGGPVAGKAVDPGTTLVLAASREKTVPADALTLALTFGGHDPLPLATIAGENPTLEFTTGAKTLAVLTIQRGNLPPVRIDGNTVTVGKLKVTLKDGQLSTQEQ